MSYPPLTLARAFMETGELEDARLALDDHLTQHPGDPEGLRMRAEVYARMPGDPALRAALADYAQLATLTPDDALRCAGLYERLGDLAGACRCIEDARLHAPGHERLTERLVTLLERLGDLDAARVLMASLPAEQRAGWRWAQAAGDLAARAGDWAQAAAHYSAALDGLAARGIAADWAGGLQARLLLARGECLRQQGLWDAAERDYQAAEVLVPDDPAIRFNRGLVAAARDDQPTALRLCREALIAATPTVRATLLAALHAETAPALIALRDHPHLIV